MNVAAAMERAVAALDLDALGRRYRDQGELVFIERALPDALVAALAAETRRAAAAAVRHHAPGFRRAGTVPHRRLVGAAPLATATYQAPAVIELLAHLTRAARGVSPPAPTATAHLYHYSRAGDRMGFHRDACSRCDHTAQTVIFGLIDASTQRLICKVPGGELRLATAPGAMVVFNASRVEHAVSPLGAGEERAVVCASYARQPRTSTLDRLIASAQEEVLFGGLRALVRSRWWSSEPAAHAARRKAPG